MVLVYTPELKQCFGVSKSIRLQHRIDCRNQAMFVHLPRAQFFVGTMCSLQGLGPKVGRTVCSGHLFACTSTL